MNEITISTQIPTALHDQLAELANASDRDCSSLIAEAIRRYITTETQILDAIDEGIGAAARGDIVSHEVVIVTMNERRQRLLQRSER